MGWRGAVRSMSAAMRAAERDAQRRQKQYLKDQMISDAAEAVSDWQSAIQDLVSMHTELATDIDWVALANKPRPSEPQKGNAFESEAQFRLDGFKPGFFDFFWGGTEKKRQGLVDRLTSAIDRDESEFRDAQDKYRTELSDWEADVALARRLLGGEVKAKREVIAEMQSLSGEALVGSSISFRISDAFLHAIVHVHGDEVVPSFRRKQLQSGRLSESKMPAGEFNELYQDYVCSAALKVAGDLFALLPIEEAYVTCVSLMLNTRTGYQDDTPILSARFVRETFRRLNLRGIDPSDSIANFVHEMNFSRARGFTRIVPLKSIEE